MVRECLGVTCSTGSIDALAIDALAHQGAGDSQFEKNGADGLPEGEQFQGLFNVSDFPKDSKSLLLGYELSLVFPLVQFGNTCYINSVLQALYYCPPFRTKVLEYASSANEDSLLSCLSDLFGQLSNTSRKKFGYQSPKKFVATVKRENGSLLFVTVCAVITVVSYCRHTAHTNLCTPYAHTHLYTSSFV